MGDGLLTIGQGRSLNKDWDGIWRPWTYIGDFGWSAEIRIPFHTLNFDPKTSTWGLSQQNMLVLPAAPPRADHWPCKIV